MIDIGSEAQLIQGPDSSDAQHHLRSHSLLGWTGIELPGNPAVVAPGEIRVQKIEGNIAERFRLPDLTGYILTPDPEVDGNARVLQVRADVTCKVWKTE